MQFLVKYLFFLYLQQAIRIVCGLINYFCLLKFQCRTSSNSTSGSKGDVEYDEVEDEYERTSRYTSRNARNSGGGSSRPPQRRKSPPKHLNVKPPSSSSGPNQYSTTAYISNGEDNAVNISITSNGNAHHDINKKPNTAPQHNSNQSKNLHSANKRNTAQNNGANSSANIRGILKLELDLISRCFI